MESSTEKNKMRMLRRNVLVDTGKKVASWESNLIVPSEDYLCINSLGNIVSIGSKCVLFSDKDIGRQVVVGLIKGGEKRIKPEAAEKLGLKPNWHFIAHEVKLVCYLEK